MQFVAHGDVMTVSPRSKDENSLTFPVPCRTGNVDQAFEIATQIDEKTRRNRQDQGILFFKYPRSQATGGQARAGVVAHW
jgi:hypothetical protein